MFKFAAIGWKAQKSTHTHTHTHTQVKCCRAIKQIGTICFAKFFKFCAVAFVAIFCGLFCNIESAHAVDYTFSVTTGNIAANGTFQFKLSAQGTFYVDCGTNGTLSSDDSTANGMISGGTITKADTISYIFKCTYSTAGSKTIQFGGAATAYNTGEVAAIRFNISGNETGESDYWASSDTNAELVSSISGNLSTIFPYLGSGSGQQPRFCRTFRGCTNLSAIPGNLFYGITYGVSSMFYQTFQNCPSLTSIPENLFSRITTGGQEMFRGTFLGSSGFTSLPENLFSGLTTGGVYMFRDTFEYARGLTGYIPPSMFAGLIANGSPYSQGMFLYAFYATGLSSSCPSGTVQYTTGYESYWDSHVACGPAINLTWYDNGTTISGASSCVVGGTFVPPTPSARTGYVFTGWKVITCADRIQGLDTDIGGSAHGYTRLDGRAGSNESTYGLTVGSGEWAVQFSYGTVYGMANCNTTAGVNMGDVNDNLRTESSGKYCWCQVTGFTPTSDDYTGGPQYTVSPTSSRWVFAITYGSSTKCASGCVSDCGYYVRSNAGFRSTMFGAVGN